MLSLNSVKLLGHIQTTPSYSEETTTSQARIWFKFKITPEKTGLAAHTIGIIGWDKHANNIAQYCSKGHQLIIEGKLESRIIHTDEGFTTDVIYIVIEKVKFGAGERKNVPIQPQAYFDNKPPHTDEQEENEYPDFQDPNVKEQEKPQHTNIMSALEELGIGTEEILNLVKKDMIERRKAAF